MEVGEIEGKVAEFLFKLLSGFLLSRSRIRTSIQEIASNRVHQMWSREGEKTCCWMESVLLIYSYTNPTPHASFQDHFLLGAGGGRRPFMNKTTLIPALISLSLSLSPFLCKTLVHRRRIWDSGAQKLFLSLAREIENTYSIPMVKQRTKIISTVHVHGFMLYVHI